MRFLLHLGLVAMACGCVHPGEGRSSISPSAEVRTPVVEAGSAASASAPSGCGPGGADVVVRSLSAPLRDAPSLSTPCASRLPGAASAPTFDVIDSAEAFRTRFRCDPPARHDFARERIVAATFHSVVIPEGNDALVFRSATDDGQVIRMRFYSSSYCGGATPVVDDVTRFYAVPVGRPIETVICSREEPCGDYAVP